MDNIYSKVIRLHFIPAAVNFAGAVYVFLNYELFQFTGYLLGAILGLILSVIWLFQVKDALHSHAIKLMKITFKGLLAKLIAFVIFMTLVYFLSDFSIFFFAVSLFIALVISAIIEIWFYTTLIKHKNS